MPMCGRSDCAASWHSTLKDLPHSKGGFAPKREAEQALRAFLANVDQGQPLIPTKVTVERYLTEWLDAVELSLAVTASSNYRTLVRCYLLPHLGCQQVINPPGPGGNLRRRALGSVVGH